MSRKDRKFKGFFRPKLGDLQKKKKKKKKKKRSSPKFRVIFRPKSKTQTFFPPKIRWSPKIKNKKIKKKGLRQNSEWFFGRNSKLKRFFRPKSGDLQKKKKGLRQISGRFFFQFRKFKRLRGGSFRMGGAIFHFSQKIGLKSPKNMRFCILHNPMGGARAPPAPPLATLLTANQDLMLWRNTFSSAQYCDEANYYGLVKHLNDLKNKNLQQLHETNWKFSFIWLRLLSTLRFKIWLWTKKRLRTTAIDVWS